jgi:hypothetical protein
MGLLVLVRRGRFDKTAVSSLRYYAGVLGHNYKFN